MNLKIRKKARAAVYKLIYASLFSSGRPNEMSLIDMIKENNIEKDENYIKMVYFGVIDKYDELIEIISKFAIGFKLDRIYKLDLSALLLAIYEMKYMEDIPHSVSIAEAIELVKTYSTENSGKYVNGILSSVCKDLNNECNQ